MDFENPLSPNDQWLPHFHFPSAHDTTSSPLDAAVAKSIFTKYDFRPSARNKTTSHITYIDQDESGDFDPRLAVAEERSSSQFTPRKRRKCNKPSAASPNNDASKSLESSTTVAARSWRDARSLNLSRPVVLKFSSAFSRLALLLYAGRDNWPTDFFLGRLPPSPGANGGYSLRSRRDKSSSPTYRKNERNKYRRDRIVDPAGLEQDLRNHPAARGCIPCRRLGFECPLLSDELAWPCTECATTGTDCALIVPPAVRAPCEDCKRKRLQCSFRPSSHRTLRQPTTTTTHGDARCDQCAVVGIAACVAGPAPGTQRLRASYDRDWDADGLPRRAYVACAACRAVGARCSLRGVRDTPPCRGCADAGRECTFGEVPEVVEISSSSSPSPSPSPTPSPRSSRESSPERAAAPAEHATATTAAATTTTTAARPGPPRRDDLIADSAGRFGHLTSIRTSFAHPVRFLPPTTRPPPHCHFCAPHGAASFGPLGLGERPAVLAIAWLGGRGYSEVAGGHASDGAAGGGTRMCAACAGARACVLACRHGGGLARMERGGRDQGEEACDERLARLLADDPAAGDAWCFACVAAAEFRCRGPAKGRGKAGGRGAERRKVGGGEEEEVGCGMTLCGECARDLAAKECGMDVRRLVAGLRGAEESGESHRRVGARADAEFLVEGGLLERNLAGRNL